MTYVEATTKEHVSNERDESQSEQGECHSRRHQDPVHDVALLEEATMKYELLDCPRATLRSHSDTANGLSVPSM